MADVPEQAIRCARRLRRLRGADRDCAAAPKPRIAMVMRSRRRRHSSPVGRWASWAKEPTDRCAPRSRTYSGQEGLRAVHFPKPGSTVTTANGALPW